MDAASGAGETGLAELALRVLRSLSSHAAQQKAAVTFIILVTTAAWLVVTKGERQTWLPTLIMNVNHQVRETPHTPPPVTVAAACSPNTHTHTPTHPHTHAPTHPRTHTHTTDPAAAAIAPRQFGEKDQVALSDEPWTRKTYATGEEWWAPLLLYPKGFAVIDRRKVRHHHAVAAATAATRPPPPPV